MSINFIIKCEQWNILALHRSTLVALECGKIIIDGLHNYYYSYMYEYSHLVMRHFHNCSSFVCACFQPAYIEL